MCDVCEVQGSQRRRRDIEEKSSPPAPSSDWRMRIPEGLRHFFFQKMFSVVLGNGWDVHKSHKD